MVEKLERKFGRFAIRGLMKYVIIVYAAGFIAYMINPNFYYEWLMLDIDKVLHGQVWRLLSFLIQPIEGDSIFFTLLMLYVYFSLGMSLESVMGSFRFNLFYFSGILFNILAVVIIYVITYFIFGTGFNYPISLEYLNLSMFLMFAATFPEARFFIMFLIPVKAKYMIWVYLGFLGLNVGTSFFSSDTYFSVITKGIVSERNVVTYSMFGDSYVTAVSGGFWCGMITLIVILISLLNFLLIWLSVRKFSIKEMQRRKEFRRNMYEGMRQNQAANRGKDTIIHAEGKFSKHRCCVCGRTENSNEELEFRFCTKCSGNHEYCSDHLYTHVHITENDSANETVPEPVIIDENDAKNDNPEE